MDLTSSMQSWISACQQLTRETVEKVVKELNFKSVRAAFVGYRDFGDSERIVTHPFTDQIKAVIDTVNKQEASGGDDTPEDLFGGLAQALEFKWENKVKVLLLCTDAPGHGSPFNAGEGDSYPNLGTVDECKAILQKMQKLGIFFYFIYSTEIAKKVL